MCYIKIFKQSLKNLKKTLFQEIDLVPAVQIIGRIQSFSNSFKNAKSYLKSSEDAKVDHLDYHVLPHIKNKDLIWQ